MKKILFAIATVAMLFATSCKDENKFNEPVAPKDPSDIPANSFYCEIDNNANPQNAPTVSNGKTTMAYLRGKHVMWQPGDAINVSGTNFINTSSENQAAYFENEDASPFQQPEYEAYYPASLYNNGSYELPAVVTIDPDRNASHLPMYAYSTDHWLTFHNLCAAMKINVPMACSRIVIEANTAICGNFTVEGKETTAPYARIDGTGCNSIEIYKKATTGDGTQNFAIGDTAFVAIPAGTYTFTIKLYEGDRLIHEKTAGSTLTCNRNKVYNITTETDFFCFEALQDGSTVKFRSSVSETSGVNLECIVKGQNTWQTYTANTEITLEKVGDRVYFRSTNSKNRFWPIRAYSETGQLKIKGNIMYLLNGTNPSNTLPDFSDHGAFEEAFLRMSALIDASELILPATTLKNKCYKDMFVSCTNMTKAPSKLPATVLAEECYYGMFNSCSRITSAPELPARILVNNCYRLMFQNCSAIHSLTIKADQGMDATTPLHNILQGAGALFPLGGTVHCTNAALSTVEANLPTNVTGWTAEADVTD